MKMLNGRKRLLLILFSMATLLFSLSPRQETLAAPIALKPNAPQLFSCADFNTIGAGNTVEGLGAVHPDLNIDAPGTAVAVADGAAPTAYLAPNDLGYINEGLGSNGGFYDTALEHEYSFSFAPGLSVDLFNLRMRDFGDWNGVNATWHQISLIAYNANDEIVDTSVLEYTTDDQQRPTSSQFGSLYISGDAVTAEEEQPGNYTFTVEGTAITRIELRFDNDVVPGTPSDDFYALDVLCFNTEQGIDTGYGTTCGDFASLGAGASVEGLGTVLPDLNISAPGNAVVLVERQAPTGFLSPNDVGSINVGAGDLGAFWDVDQLHQYEFSFAPGQTVSSFGLRLIDFGDWNGVNATWHQISLEAYDAVGNLVDSSIFEYITDDNNRPTSELYGSLYDSGDAAIALDGQPGNRAFVVEGSGITRIELSFDNDAIPGTASDDFYGIHLMCFDTEDDQPDIPYGSSCVDFAAVGAGGSVEGLGTVHPDIDISTLSGSGVALVERAAPTGFKSPNDIGTINGGVGIFGGLWDLDMLHAYTFSISPGRTASSFGLRIIDFGDWNGSSNATWHQVSLVGYNENGDVVDSDVLEYTTDDQNRPTSSQFGNLYYSGDALVAEDGEPGNRAYVVEGEGIVRVELTFDNNVDTGVASDDFYGIHLMCFDSEEISLDPPTAELTLIRPKQAPAIGGKFLVEYACSETAPNLVSATINGYDVVNGQEVSLVVSEDESARIVNDLLIWLFAPEFSMDVTCADDNGNEVSTSIAPEFDTP